MSDTISEELISSKIYLIRGQKVMLDRDLAEMYGVETRRLNEQVKRNIERFTPNYMFELTKEENNILRSQNATLKQGQHSKYSPYVFSEHGVLILMAVFSRRHAIKNRDKMMISPVSTLFFKINALHSRRNTSEHFIRNHVYLFGNFMNR